MSEAMIDHLERLRDRRDRAALSALRRGLSGDAASQAHMHPHVVPFLPKYERLHDWYYLVASLFGLHPEAGGQGSFGAAMRRVVALMKSTSTEARFIALLDAHPEDLPDHLRHAIDLARAKSVPVDYRQLLKDLNAWDHPDQYVQRRWARDFWAPSTKNSSGSTQGESHEG